MALIGSPYDKRKPKKISSIVIPTASDLNSGMSIGKRVGILVLSTRKLLIIKMERKETSLRSLDINVQGRLNQKSKS